MRQKEKQARQKHEQRQKAVNYELKQVLSQRKSVSKLKLVDKPLCNYFRTYERVAAGEKGTEARWNKKISVQQD